MIPDHIIDHIMKKANVLEKIDKLNLKYEEVKQRRINYEISLGKIRNILNTEILYLSLLPENRINLLEKISRTNQNISHLRDSITQSIQNIKRCGQILDDIEQQKKVLES